MDTARVENIIKYALACASRLDDFNQQELAPIHFVKIVYLADLAYAQRKGETFTGAPWMFHHYGPWSLEVNDRIEPVMAKLNAQKRTFQNKQGQKGTRFRLTGSSFEKDAIFDQLESQLPFAVASAIKRTVRRFSNDTYGLLAHVYKSLPMREAKPGEPLKFTKTESIQEMPQSEDENRKISVKERKRRKSKREEMRSRYKEATKKRLEESKSSQLDTPLYDETFFEGLVWLDSLAGTEVREEKGTLAFGNIWHSDIRNVDEIP